MIDPIKMEIQHNPEYKFKVFETLRGMIVGVYDIKEENGAVKFLVYKDEKWSYEDANNYKSM